MKRVAAAGGVILVAAALVVGCAAWHYFPNHNWRTVEEDVLYGSRQMSGKKLDATESVAVLRAGRKVVRLLLPEQHLADAPDADRKNENQCPNGKQRQRRQRRQDRNDAHA